jgi:hypothetical protein
MDIDIDVDINVDDHQIPDSVVNAIDADEDLSDAQNAYEDDLSNLEEVGSTDFDPASLEDLNEAVGKIVSEMSKPVKDKTDRDYKR